MRGVRRRIELGIRRHPMGLRPLPALPHTAHKRAAARGAAEAHVFSSRFDARLTYVVWTHTHQEERAELRSPHSTAGRDGRRGKARARVAHCDRKRHDIDMTYIIDILYDIDIEIDMIYCMISVTLWMWISLIFY